VGVAW